MIVYFELHCISKNKTEHKICNVQMKPNAKVQSGNFLDINILEGVSDYDYDFSILIDLNKNKIIHNEYLEEKVKEVKKVIDRSRKLKKLLNGKF